jgi:hypothetical protein
MIESSEQCSTNAYKHQPVPTPLVPVLVPVADVTIQEGKSASPQGWLFYREESHRQGSPDRQTLLYGQRSM